MQVKNRSTLSAVAPVTNGCVDDTRNTTQTLATYLRELIRHIDAHLPAGITRRDIPTNEVLLDTEIDGVRCLVIKTATEGPRAPVLLSPREQEIVRLVALGHPNKVIAAVLDISCWTVSTHLRRIFAKLGVASRAAMVARAGGKSDVPPRSNAG